jgi:hypothetical protein
MGSGDFEISSRHVSSRWRPGNGTTERIAMTINTTCPLCHETIGHRAMKIEPVLAGRVALHDYSCPSCGVFLFIDADGALSDDAIMERIDRHRQEIVESYKSRFAG